MNDKQLYAAPMEGLTGWLWRRVHHELFGGADKYFTPFLSPNANHSFQAKECDEIEPAHNEGLPVVPQILTNSSEHFIWCARELHARGYGEVNLNLGCPSGTVTGKRKGSGLLAFPDELDRLLGEIFTALPELRISVKTRIGKLDPAEWEHLLAIYNRYPIAELIVHPRVQKEFYKGRSHRDVFAWTLGQTQLPLCESGDLFTPRLLLSSPAPAAMAGRGLIADPALLRRTRGGAPASREELLALHDRLFEGYRERLSGDQPVLHRMRELWNYLSLSFVGAQPGLKAIRKAKICTAYAPAAREILTNCPLREVVEEDFF